MALMKLAAALVVCGGTLVPAAAASSASTSGASTSAATAGGAQAASPAVPDHKRAPVLLDCVGTPETRPGKYVVACGDGNDYLTGIHWTSWTSGAAHATATNVANDCVPYCAAGHFHSYPVKVTLERPVSWGGHPGRQRFTRLVLDFPGARPKGMPAQVTWPLPKGPASVTAL